MGSGRIGRSSLSGFLVNHSKICVYFENILHQLYEYQGNRSIQIFISNNPNGLKIGLLILNFDLILNRRGIYRLKPEDLSSAY